jgi:serine/threonine protein kinase
LARILSRSTISGFTMWRDREQMDSSSPEKTYCLSAESPSRYGHRAETAPQAGKDRADQALAEVRKIAHFKSKDIASVYHVDRLPSTGWIYAVMEYVEGEPLANLRASLNDAAGLPMRTFIWGNVYRGLDAAERAGVYHGDLHDGNVIVTSFLGDVTLIDFGTSVLAGKKFSLKRHAKKVQEFAQRLIPELSDYVSPLDIPNLVRPEYATYVVGQWVEASRGLQKLEPLLSDISEQDLAQRLASLAGNCSTTLIDIHGPVATWLAGRGISSVCLGAYTSAASAAVARQKELPYPPRVGLPLRPVPPYEVA